MVKGSLDITYRPIYICVTTFEDPTSMVPSMTNMTESLNVPIRPNLWVTLSVANEPINPPMVNIEVITPNVPAFHQNSEVDNESTHRHGDARLQRSTIYRPMIQITANSILDTVQACDSHSILHGMCSSPNSRRTKSPMTHCRFLHD